MLCYNCFKKIIDNGPCPYCEYDNSTDNTGYPQALPCGSILNGRYIVGRVLDQSRFGITYKAQDYKTKELVAIEEYLPLDCATRSNRTHELMAYSGDKAELLEYGRQKFFERASALAQFNGNDSICELYNCFEENRTSYLVMEYAEGVTLDRYISFGGRMAVDEANWFLPPLMNALILMHSNGITHRNLTPDSILITEENSAKLLVSPMLDDIMYDYENGGGNTEIKHGYSPIEQYGLPIKQGVYTDVYMFAATYYYAITGKAPQDAIDRMYKDSVIYPSLCGVKKLRRESENALMKALSMQISERFQSMKDFKEALTDIPYRMTLRECVNGHIFDTDIYSSCPYCGGYIMDKIEIS